MIYAVLIRLWIRCVAGLLWIVDRFFEGISNAITWGLYHLIFRWVREKK
jgi:hypothetical protein